MSLKHAPEFEDMRLTELRIIEQTMVGWLWKVELSQYQGEKLDAK